MSALLRWLDLVWLPDEELAKLDIARVNLACADGLPGADKIDIEACIRKIDCMADYCRRYIDWHLPHFHRDPGNFNNSLGYFKILLMITALCDEFRVRYNPRLIKDNKNIEGAKYSLGDTFVHGLLFGEGGTCASMPVLYAAVGRRLGYPIKLVLTKTKNVLHVFNRWDGEGERFNIEGTNNGLSVLTDEEYQTGFWHVEPKQIRLMSLLRSMSPRDELAGFLTQRGCCWQDARNDREACRAFMWALALDPPNRHYYNGVVDTMNAWIAKLRAAQPKGFPAVRCRSGERRFPPCMPADIEKDFNCLEAWETILNDDEQCQRFWDPMCLGVHDGPWPKIARCTWWKQAMSMQYEY